MEIAYYEHGILIDVSPRTVNTSLYDDRDVAYRASRIVSDGVEYDLTIITDIQRLPIPNFPQTWDTTSEMSYILKIHLSYVTDPQIIPPMVEKVLCLMRSSHLLWRRRDYLQVIRNYYKHGLFELGDAFEKRYRASYPELFSAPEDKKQETEHFSTKAYFKRKWDKKNSRA